MSKENVLGILRNHFGEDADSDEILELYGRVSDEMDRDASAGEEWKKKYEELDKTWRQRYKERFFSGGNTTEDGEYERRDYSESESEEQYRKEHPSFDDIFRKRNK